MPDLDRPVTLGELLAATKILRGCVGNLAGGVIAVRNKEERATSYLSAALDHIEALEKFIAEMQGGEWEGDTFG
jgi:hypothetical protein